MNTLKQDRNHNTFTWESLGDIKKGVITHNQLNHIFGILALIIS